MIKHTLFILIIFMSFIAGFLANTILANMGDLHLIKKATGIGGIFFKCKDPAKLKQWYKDNLGINTNQYGAVFEWYQGADSTKKGFTQWSPFKETTKYFGKEDQKYMINYRVENLELLVLDLKNKNVKILDTIESYDYGKFIHIEDIEGTKIELWEPNDLEYEKNGQGIE